MSEIEFNHKYNEYIENGFYGLEIDIPELTSWLDNKFQEFIKKPGFRFYQIKSKFGQGRFYCEGLSMEEILEVESKIGEFFTPTARVITLAPTKD